MHALCACQVTTPDSREHFVTVPSTSPNTNLGASGQGASVFLRRFPKAYTPASFLLLNRAELIDLMYRMKGFDAGHLSRKEANVPRSADADSQAYAKSHDARMEVKRKKKQKKKKKASVKDEV